MLKQSPSEHRLLARGALVQLKASPVSGEAQAIGLQLAVVTRSAEAALDVLQQSETFDHSWSSWVRPLRDMAEERWRTGNPKTMRIGSGLAFELVRLRAEPALGWDEIVARAESEKDDLSMAQLVRTLSKLAVRDQTMMRARMRWLLEFGKAKGKATREAVLEIYSTVSGHVNRRSLQKQLMACSI